MTEVHQTRPIDKYFDSSSTRYRPNANTKLNLANRKPSKSSHVQGGKSILKKLGNRCQTNLSFSTQIRSNGFDKNNALINGIT